MTTLSELITRAENVLAVLEGLIEGDASKTLLVDDSVSYALPTVQYSETTDEWTLSQDTADTDSFPYIINPTQRFPRVTITHFPIA